MGRAGFTEHRYVCILCGGRFTALGGAAPVADPVCTSCGLRWPSEKLKKLVAEKKGKRERT
jgi:hypothetical protein